MNVCFGPFHSSGIFSNSIFVLQFAATYIFFCTYFSVLWFTIYWVFAKAPIEVDSIRSLYTIHIIYINLYYHTYNLFFDVKIIDANKLYILLNYFITKILRSTLNSFNYFVTTKFWQLNIGANTHLSLIFDSSSLAFITTPILADIVFTRIAIIQEQTCSRFFAILSTIVELFAEDCFLYAVSFYVR